MNAGQPSPVMRRCVDIAAPLALVIGTYLLFAGHNSPGGGFASGLVFGAVVTLRTFAGSQRTINAQGLIAVGVLVVAAVAAVPMILGDALLDQSIWSFELPILGKVKSGSALPFDIGVTAIVVGLVAALLNGMSDDEATSDAPHRHLDGQELNNS